MTKKDCIRKFLCGKKVRGFTIPTCILVALFNLFIFLVIRPWRFCPIEFFAVLQIVSLVATSITKLCKILCQFDEDNDRMSGCFIIIFASSWLTITVCGFIHEDISFQRHWVDLEESTDSNTITSLEEKDNSDDLTQFQQQLKLDKKEESLLAAPAIQHEDWQTLAEKVSK